MVEVDKAIKDPTIMEELKKRKTFTPIRKINAKKGMARPCLIEKEEE